MLYTPNYTSHPKPKRPAVTQLMGQILSEPITVKDTASCQNRYFCVGSSCMQGWRATMEDSHTHILSLPDDPGTAFFGVYDGHGGVKIAQYAGKHLHKHIVKSETYKDGKIAKSLKQAFLEFDEIMSDIEELKAEHSGSTANTVLVKDQKLYCANTGDSRAVACVKGKALPLSHDHKPYVEAEFIRITAAGGWVDANRVNGNLALSRALGDYSFKKNEKLSPIDQMVTAYPDVQANDLTSDWEFVVMGCDGIWDVVTNQDCVDYIRRHIAAGDEPEEICENVMMHCLAPKLDSGGIGCDNMTILIIAFLHDGTYEELSAKCARPIDPTPVPSVEQPVEEASVAITEEETEPSTETRLDIVIPDPINLLEEEVEIEIAVQNELTEGAESSKENDIL